MNEKRWRRGDVILMQGYNPKLPKLITVMPQVVVEDRDDYLAIVTLPGMTFLTRDEPGRSSMPLDDMVRMYLETEPRRDWYERRARRTVLTLLPPGCSYSIRLFWDADGVFQCWYVNLEQPYRRRPEGIEVRDNHLDLVVAPDLTWSWKDEDELEALTLAGFYSAEQAAAIRAEGERAIERIEARQWPFDQAWPEWRPDPAWKAPQIRELWSP